VTVLAEALLKSTQTCLRILGPKNVGLGDKGIAALASLDEKGRMKQLKLLIISKNKALTQQGIITLARAIEAHGLPMREEFRLRGLDADNVTLLGISAIALAVITRCPNLKRLSLMCSGSDEVYHEMVVGMLQAVGRAGEVALS
jgi:hypothetical protein